MTNDDTIPTIAELKGNTILELLSNVYTTLKNAIFRKQNKLIAGSNIVINGDTISAIEGGTAVLDDYYTKEETDGLLDDYYDKTEVDDFLTQIEEDINDKQDILTAGNNISIENNVISATSMPLQWEYRTPRNFWDDLFEYDSEDEVLTTKKNILIQYMNEPPIFFSKGFTTNSDYLKIGQTKATTNNSIIYYDFYITHDHLTTSAVFSRSTNVSVQEDGTSSIYKLFITTSESTADKTQFKIYVSD